MITRECIVEFFGGKASSLPPQEIEYLLAAANADADEGADWLPFYKMALNRLVECCGALRALAELQAQTSGGREALLLAGRLYYEHLLLCGIGPQRNPDLVRQCEQRAAEGMAEFIEPKR